MLYAKDRRNVILRHKNQMPDGAFYFYVAHGRMRTPDEATQLRGPKLQVQPHQYTSGPI